MAILRRDIPAPPQPSNGPDGNSAEGMDSKFRFVLVASNRAEQLMRGARPKIDMPTRKPTVVAMREIEKRVVDWGYGQSTEEPVESEGEDQDANA